MNLDTSNSHIKGIIYNWFAESTQSVKFLRDNIQLIMILFQIKYMITLVIGPSTIMSDPIEIPKSHMKKKKRKTENM